LPLCEAVSVQVPVPEVIVTVLPAIEHTPLGVMLTARPDVDVAFTANVALYAAGVVGCANVMVCAAGSALTIALVDAGR